MSDDEASCQGYLDGIEDYVTAQLERQELTGPLRELAEHLDRCLPCSRSYALVYEARLAEVEGRLPTPGKIPAPDLSFLRGSAVTSQRRSTLVSAPGAEANQQQPATLPGQDSQAAQPQPATTSGHGPQAAQPPQPATTSAQLSSPQASPAASPMLGELLQGALRRAGSTITLHLSQALLDLLPRPQGPALAFRGATAELPRYELALDKPAARLEWVRLSIYEQSDQLATVRVQVQLEGLEWPDLAEVPVSIMAGEQRRHAGTDAWGQAVFEDVPLAALASLQLEVAV